MNKKTNKNKTVQTLPPDPHTKIHPHMINKNKHKNNVQWNDYQQHGTLTILRLRRIKSDSQTIKGDARRSQSQLRLYLKGDAKDRPIATLLSAS